MASHYDSFSDHVELIYQTVDGDVNWDDTLARIVCDLNYFGGVIYLDKLSGGTSLAISTPGIDDKDIRSYENYYCLKDTWVELLSQQPKNEFTHSEKAISRRDYLKTEIYNDWGKKYKIQSAVGAHVKLAATNDFLLRIAFQKSTSSTRDVDADLAHFNALIPHFARAFVIAQEIQKEHNLRQLVAQVHQSNAQAIIFDEYLRIHYRSPGFGYTDDHVATIKKRLKPFVRQYLKVYGESLGLSASIVADKGVPIFTTTVYIYGLQYHLITYRLRSSERSVFDVSYKSRGLLFATSVQSPNLTGEGCFSGDWGLTKSESEVAYLLFQGKSPQQISVFRSRSLHTIRTQIKAILSKSDTNRVPELVALMKVLSLK